MQRTIVRVLGRTTTLTAVATIAAAGTSSKEAQACGLVYEDNIFLYPLNHDEEVPTNAKLIGIRNGSSGGYWLRKVIDAGEVPDAQADADVSGGELPGDADVQAALALPLVNGLDAGLEGTAEVPVTLECVERTRDPVCIGTAALEPNTRYVWGATDATEFEPPQWFTTGDGPRDPNAVPELSFDVLRVRPATGGGDCAAIEEGTIQVNVGATSEPWIFIPGNTRDVPTRIEGGQAQFTWSTIDPDGCIGAEQMNWAGEVFNTNLEVCLPPATDAGPDSGGGGDGSSSPEAGMYDSDEQSSPDTAPTSDVVTSDEPTSLTSDTSSANSTAGLDAGADNTGGPITDAAGCSCRTGARSPSTAAGWAGLALLGWVARRRKRG